MAIHCLLKKVLIITVFLLFLTTNVFGAENSQYSKTMGQVVEANKVHYVTNSSSGEQSVKVKIISGPFQGQVFQMKNNLLSIPWPHIVLTKGDKVVLTLEEQEGKLINVFLSDFGRSDALYFLLGAFIVFLIAIGGTKGMKAILALFLTVFFLFFILLPLILNGYNPIKITLFVLTLVIIITMPMIGGLNKKSLAATLGTIGGVAIAGSLAYISGEIFQLSGFIDEEAQQLLFIPNLADLDLKGLLFSGMIIGAIGATMDVGMSIASSIEEVWKTNPRVSSIRLFGAGLNVGRDIIGTMANTLILAYVGSSLPILLLFIAERTSSIVILNSELVSTEVVRAISGTIGLLFTVPITSFFAASLQKHG
ncbi:MAG: YibE/F family protein [Dehalobacterium sp.]